VNAPPTPRSANQSPFPTQAQVPMPTKQPQYFASNMMQTSMNPHLLQTSWESQTESDSMDESMDFLSQFDSPLAFDPSVQYPQSPVPSSYMAMTDWNGGIDMDFKDFFRPRPPLDQLSLDAMFSHTISTFHLSFAAF